MQQESTKGSNILDQYFMNKPGLLTFMYTTPVVSIHEILLSHTEVKLPTPRKSNGL